MKAIAASWGLTAGILTRIAPALVYHLRSAIERRRFVVPAIPVPRQHRDFTGPTHTFGRPRRAMAG